MSKAVIGAAALFGLATLMISNCAAPSRGFLPSPDFAHYANFAILLPEPPGAGPWVLPLDPRLWHQ